MQDLEICTHPAFFTDGRCLECGQPVYLDCYTVKVAESGSERAVLIHAPGCGDTTRDLRCGFDKPAELVERQRKAREEAAKRFWCHCGNPSGEVDFHDDNDARGCKHPERCSKHHYDCRDCGFVVQTG